MVKKIGIDLGTSITKICVKGKGIVLREPTAVAYDKNSGEIIASGTKAKKMIGKTPPEKEVVTPMRGGVIADFEDCVQMLSSFLYKIHARGIMSRPKIAVAIPCGITEVERNAFENVCVAASGRDIFMLVKEPMAAALGADVDIIRTKGRLIVDIGGGNTQSTVISYRGTVQSGMIRTGGLDFDAAIVRYVKDQYNVVIGRQTAEMMKKSIGSAHPMSEKGDCEIYGRNVLNGQVERLVIRSGEIRIAVEEELTKITESIRSVLESTPPELSSDAYDTGMILCGGSALLSGIDKFISEKLGMPVFTCIHPLDCVSRGMERIISSPSELAETVCLGEDEDL